MHPPLAVTLRPKTIDEVVGQDHLLGPGKVINKMVKAHRLSSFILYGKPGIGKSTIAYAIANTLDMPFLTFNAATDSKKDLQAAVKESEKNQIVLLVDEIHRLTKPLQDYLLPYTENGQIIMIGATTQNPYIEIAPAIRSRAQIFELHPVTTSDMEKVLDRAVGYLREELNKSIDLSDDAKNLLSTATIGDVRSMLTALEIAVYSSDQNPIEINVSDIEDIVQKKQISADKSGDSHYDVLSALQKSIRGSDTDAALHYASRLIAAGDLQSLVRRLTVMAYEDIGLADPVAAQQATTAINTATSIGLPEARIPLANAIILLATAPKSNAAYLAINEALNDVNSGHFDQIPNAIKDAHYAGAGKLGHGQGYKYAHDFPYDWVAQQYLPDDLYRKNPNYFRSKHTSATEDALETRYQTLKTNQHKIIK
jgi:putative ATPase